ncbi:hypothetical protein P8917_10060 [Bacillus atrophaeus]|uniref:hypothetical protein n=1 Tax=Bacillus atrophaeus TaxID=1452 RepID=UPI0022830241|nr:hypothetical protein [Bacillus atrophaeus]MCY8814908.1 hypothetical protein [Bacillus atrophaeus]MCY8821546.1 hypothetical protein [Bacillus atrophaeus]MCY8830976.1 hypothetical protein [Bacillus atrophaeus]MCY8835235.1 hypothetical protein [Bacillus atrophaeus]MEC0828886.1 hypothetical protein [Bacillus atrophaeus]
MSDQVFYTVSEGKRKREELTLPILYFSAADALPGAESWIETLGPKAFCAWLQLHTLVDRTDEAQSEYGNKQTVPRSIENLAKDIFKIGKPTFYRTIIKPLWNYGLIDIVEWKAHKKIGQKAMNIIVYHYPQNNKALETQPLKKVRDYEKDYQSNGKIFGILGGRKANSSNSNSDRFKNETVRNTRISFKNVDLLNRFKNRTVTVSRMKPLTVHKMKPINNSNTLVNNSNTLVNNSNSFNSSSSLTTKQNDDDDKKINRTKLLQLAINQNEKLRELAIFLNDNDVEWDYIEDIILLLHKDQVQFTRRSAVQQLEWMFKKMQTEPISNFVIYFVNGLKQKSTNDKAVNKYENDADAFWNAKINMVQKDIKEKEAKRKKFRPSVPFYDWLNPTKEKSKNDTPFDYKSDIPY